MSRTRDACTRFAAPGRLTSLSCPMQEGRTNSTTPTAATPIDLPRGRDGARGHGLLRDDGVGVAGEHMLGRQGRGPSGGAH